MDIWKKLTVAGAVSSIAALLGVFLLGSANPGNFVAAILPTMFFGGWILAMCAIIGGIWNL